MKERRNKVLRAFAVLAAAGVLYGLITGWLGFGIPCPVHYFTGFKCPGCGVSRMFISLMKLDFKSAFEANRLLLVNLPVIASLLFVYFFRYIKTGSRKISKAENIIYLMLIILFLIFGIVRNCPGINW
ncbi:MAG TPA: DUF2752 domain-containing protein [Candidatus Limousia pullorum]|uniref:DUF2752 domain-containing protein n=1 Tax=Candidatus Limousia pullorum TaxID=2840860 RepID=A0A9D1LY94_9FIRM|nr:DUF2752 domain-containing protein [Candidatus Limousia pullorum]